MAAPTTTKPVNTDKGFICPCCNQLIEGFTAKRLETPEEISRRIQQAEDNYDTYLQARALWGD
jgi:hypothetical protein